jgi:hypothetical protein
MGLKMMTLRRPAVDVSLVSLFFFPKKYVLSRVLKYIGSDINTAED